MGVFGTWVLDDRKFLRHDEVSRVRRDVRKHVGRARFRRRLPWLEWFLIELALETGLRVAEMAGLKCSDLVVHVVRCGVMVRRGKGGKSRFVRIRSSFVKSCEDFLHWKEAIGEPAGPEDPVFRSTTTKEHLTTRALQKMFTRVCRRVSVTGHSVHHCRHTYASQLYRASGRDIRLVQRQLGHSSIKITEVYAHVFDKDTDRAVEKLYA